MGQVLHGSAKTTAAMRRAMQHRQESLRALARRYGINQKTVARWRRRTSVTNQPARPKDPKSIVLLLEDEYPLGYFHIEPTEVRTEQGKLYLIVAIDPDLEVRFTPGTSDDWWRT